MFGCLYLIELSHKVAAEQAMRRAKAERQQDLNARKWLRANLSSSQMLRFQERVHGIHKRLEQVLARNGHWQNAEKAWKKRSRDVLLNF